VTPIDPARLVVSILDHALGFGHADLAACELPPA